jgi:hypothetical protein
MNRREAVIVLSALFGTTLFGAHRLLAGAINNSISGPELFDSESVKLLDALGETILPATPDSGGAQAAKIGEFINEMVRDFYSEEERATFTAGLREVATRGESQPDVPGFLEMTEAERHSFLLGFERATPVPEFYRMLKQLTLWGYFTSEIGMTQALNHVAIPGRFEGCIPLGAGTKAWAE